MVCAIDPRLLPALAPHVERTMPAMPPVVCHVGLSAPVRDLAHEVVVHGDPMLVVRAGGRAPAGGAAYTVHGRGKLAEDILRALARHQLDLRTDLVTRVDLTPRDLVEQWQTSPYGVLWQGRGTVRQRLGPRTPIEGVYAAGAHATPGAGLPFVGLSAALVAQVIGRLAPSTDHVWTLELQRVPGRGGCVGLEIPVAATISTRASVVGRHRAGTCITSRCRSRSTVVPTRQFSSSSKVSSGV